MPLDTSIALQAKAPEMQNPLEMMLKVGQYKYLQQNSNKLQQETDSTNALGQLIQKNTGPDGKVNLPGVLAGAANTPDAAYALKDYVGTNQTQQGQQISNQGGQIKNESDKFALQKDYMGTALQTASGLVNDPRITAPAGEYSDTKAGDAISEGFQQMVAKGVPVSQALVAVSPYVNAVHQPGAVATMLKNTIQGQMAPQGQATVGNPSGINVSNGQQSSTINTNQFSGVPVGAPIPGTTQEQKLAPGQQSSIGSDQLGNPYIVQRAPTGDITGTRAVPNSYNPTNGSAPSAGPVTLPPGAAGDIKAVSEEVGAARATANNAPVLHDLNRSIVSEASKGFATGKLGEFTQKLASATGYKLSSTDATGYNMLGKLLERSASQAAQGMGPHTNAGLDSARAANGSTGYDAKSIRNIAQLNDALVTGSEHYRTGLEAAIQAAGGNQLAKRQFDQAWAQNFDPRIMRLQNATQTGDKAETAQVLKEVGGPGSKGAAELAAKAQKLNLLISRGHL